MHQDPLAITWLGLAFVSLLGLIGRAAARGVGQPAVLGELLVGIAAVNLAALGEVSLTKVVTGVHEFANLGVILLLFLIGLETRVGQMLKVGRSSILVAVVGVTVPLVLGLGSAYYLLPQWGLTTHLFIAAALCATSVGITARVLKDLGRIEGREAKIVLGAAVIDDVLGLILLAVVSAMASATDWDLAPVLKTLGLSAAFIGLAIAIGPFIVRRVIAAFQFLDHERFKLFFSLSFCFAMAWIASEIGLASIVGAFVAGLIINDEDFGKKDQENETLEQLISPIEGFFAPVFFVTMGLRVDLGAFFSVEILSLALALTLVGIAGKMVCGLAAGRGVNRWAVGLGMVPRGEVGLIFAAAGKALGVIDDGIFASVVMMIVLTTLVTPPALRWTLGR